MGRNVGISGKSIYRPITKQEKLAWSWPARLTIALGASMVQNAAANKGMFDELHLTLWLLRLSYQTADKRLIARIVPSTAFGAYCIARYGSFSLGKSLQSGGIYYEIPTAELLTGVVKGRALATAVAVETAYHSTSRYYEVAAHELLHSLQYTSAVWLNPVFTCSDTAFKQNGRVTFFSRAIFTSI